MKLIPPEELSNEQYQELPEISGSDLNTVYKKSLAHWKYSEPKTTKALEFGIASHAMILEPERFDDDFAKALDREEYPDALVTQKDLQAWLKDKGQKSSGMSKAEMVRYVLNVAENFGLDVSVWDEMVLQHEALHQGKTILSVEDYGKIHMMRDAILKNEKMSRMLKNGKAEHSIVGKLDGFDIHTKVRPDLITANNILVNYKTSQDINPEVFGRKCYDYGYLLKASLEWDMFKQLTGNEPGGYIILAQEKESPYVWKPYYLTPEHLAIGRAQRDYAANLIATAIENESFPAYGSDLSPLELPDYITKKYRGI